MAGDGMTDREIELLEKMKEREQCFLQILSLTQEAVLNEDDIEAYSALMSGRQALFDKIYEVDKFLEKADSAALMKNPGPVLSRETEAVNGRIKSAASKIYDYDKTNEPVINKMRAKFRNDFKRANAGKAMRNIYADYETHGGRYFDKKK